MFCFQVNSVITTIFVGLVVILILMEKSRIMGSRKGSRRESRRGVHKWGSTFCLHPSLAYSVLQNVMKSLKLSSITGSEFSIQLVGLNFSGGPQAIPRASQHTQGEGH